MNLNELLNEGMSDQYQIYCDMDGVLCDFEKRFEHFSGLTPEEYKYRAEREFGPKIGIQKFWELIDDQVGIRFFRGMSWMPQGHELWDYIKNNNPTLLTAPSRNDVSVEGKKLWVEDNLGDYPIIFKQAHEKPELAGPNKILIDDREDTILSWRARNGIGILYTGDTEATILELKKMGI